MAFQRGTPRAFRSRRYRSYFGWRFLHGIIKSKSDIDNHLFFLVLTCLVRASNNFGSPVTSVTPRPLRCTCAFYAMLETMKN